MKDIADKSCEACRIGAPRVTDEEIKSLHPQVPDWEIIEENGIHRLRRSFTCKNFIEALELTQKVGVIAEQEGHHPAILVEYGRVTVTWWSHKIKGLHVNDFVMAAKTDRLV